jgi:hypothetical protein
MNNLAYSLTFIGEELANLEMFLILTNLLKDFAFGVPLG